ncbi:response regulator [Paenibacillus sp. LMG 31459]|uniref:Response regulator n=1 Tax=Paenibacillus phytohabitans TaxID=2654978 RepID=A0ABX1YMU6_9BACL|nr:response regulator [Paenibacillus phytohabitans]NOU82267.1 response regulator [Paenibacillus phytohabitans]
MYKILVVDDEPRVSAGIKNFLLASDMNITYVETAINGFEAIDYLRMDRFDLVLTDIQMGRMSGIELMENIYMEQWNVPVIVISAHEKFDFAKKSLRLGAKDYLVKPVERAELLRVVRKALTQKELPGKSLEADSRPIQDQSRRNEWLMELVTERNLTRKDIEDVTSELGELLQGQFFGVISSRIDYSQAGFSQQKVTLHDRKLLKYAAINIMNETLMEWNGLTFNGFGHSIISIIQLSAEEMGDPQVRVHSQIHMIGQMIAMNMKQYLNVEATIGLSTLGGDVLMLPRLMEEADTAAEWTKVHPGQRVFYYHDIAVQDNLSMVVWMSKVSEFMEQMKSAVESAGYVNPQNILGQLPVSEQSQEVTNSYCGMLIYRIYGLLVEYGQGNGVSLYDFNPDMVFQGLSGQQKLERLHRYIEDSVAFLQQLSKARDQNVISRITSYIQKNYRNPALKIQDISEEVHFSAAHLGYIFKRDMKTNLWDYVTALRMEEARRLMITTDKKRYEIAFAVGYESPEHFSRMFKRMLGLTPAEFRKQARGGNRTEAETETEA